MSTSFTADSTATGGGTQLSLDQEAQGPKQQNEINISSLASLVQATNLTERQVHEYISVHYKRLFEVKTYDQIEKELQKMRSQTLQEKRDKDGAFKDDEE